MNEYYFTNDNDSPMKKYSPNGGKVMIVSPEKFYELFQEQAIQIIDLKILPPTSLGDGFGSFRLEYLERK